MGDNEEIRLQLTTIIKHNQLDPLAIRNWGSKMRTQRGGPMELWWEYHELTQLVSGASQAAGKLCWSEFPWNNDH